MPFEVYFGSWGWPWTSCGRPLEMPSAWPGSRTVPGPPEWAGLHSRPGGSIVLPGSRDPGHGQSGGRFGFSGPYYLSNNCLIQGTFISELLDLRLRKVTVELFDWTANPQPGGTLQRGAGGFLNNNVYYDMLSSLFLELYGLSVDCLLIAY